LKDVAELAHVSEPTVSRVLNGRPGVSPSTRDRVVAALADLGFDAVPEPSSIRQGVIGLICGEFTNPVFATFVDQISAELAKLGELTTVAVTDRALNPEERCVDEFVETGVGGIVFIGGHHAEVDGDLGLYRRLADRGVGVILVNGRSTDLPVPHIRCDEEAGSVKATRHLLQLGHTRIGCVLGSSRYIPTSRFIAGYRQTMGAAGRPEPTDAIVESVFTVEGGRAGATRLLSSGITGIICGNDLMALGAIHAAVSAGLRVPEDVSIVGYDGTDFTSFVRPSLTTLRQPFEDIAKLVARAVVDERNGGTRYRDEYVFEPELVARGSSGTHRADMPAAR
jgi:alanine racemase